MVNLRQFDVVASNLGFDFGGVRDPYTLSSDSSVSVRWLRDGALGKEI